MELFTSASYIPLPTLIIYVFPNLKVLKQPSDGYKMPAIYSVGYLSIIERNNSAMVSLIPDGPADIIILSITKYLIP